MVYHINMPIQFNLTEMFCPSSETSLNAIYLLFQYSTEDCFSQIFCFVFYYVYMIVQYQNFGRAFSLLIYCLQIELSH